MAASNTDLLKKYRSLFSTTLSVGIGTGTSDTITPSTVTGLPTDTAITLTFDRVDSSGVATPSKLERILGIISGGNFTSYVRAKDNTTEQAHSAGAVIEMVWNAQDWNDLVDWGLVEHNQLGTHKTGFMVASYFSASSINSSAINASAVTSGRIGASAVVSGNLAASAVVSGNIGASAIVLGNLGASSVSSGNLNFTPSGILNTTQYAPDGFLINGQIVPSVAASDLTVAIKGMDGNDPSVSNPVYVRIGNTVRTITGALSVTKNDATNWFNAGAAEFAAREIDYFVYLGYNATDGVVIGFSRIPYARIYSDFSATTTNERYAGISTIANAAAGDDYVVVGRFAAILSAGAGYTWTVPTFTSKNLIQYPIFESRWLLYVPTHTGFSSAPTNTCRYKVRDTLVMLVVPEATQGTSNSTSKSMTLPLSLEASQDLSMVMSLVLDNTSWATTPGHIRLTTSTPTVANIGKTVHMAAWTSSGTAGYAFQINYPIA